MEDLSLYEAPHEGKRGTRDRDLQNFSQEKGREASGEGPGPTLMRICMQPKKSESEYHGVAEQHGGKSRAKFLIPFASGKCADEERGKEHSDEVTAGRAS